MLVAIFRDPAGLPGTAIGRVVQALVGQHADWMVCTGAVEGANVPSVLRQDGSVMCVGDFLRIVEGVTQFDWGDFYLLSAAQAAKGLGYMRRGYQSLIPHSEYLVRAVDDTYVYVFSTSADAEFLRTSGIPWESLEDEDLQGFVFPD